MDSDKMKLKEETAAEILRLAHSSILLKMRFMGVALNRLEVHSYECGGMATDGDILLYDPDFIINCYRSEPDVVTRNYMHIYLHCIFCHMYGGDVDPVAWDTACDIAVENILNEWDLQMFNAARTAEQKRILAPLSEVKLLTAEKLYSYFIDKKFTHEQLNQVRAAFFVDSHELWYKVPEGGSGGAGDENGDGESNSGNNNSNSEDNSGNNDSPKKQLQDRDSKSRRPENSDWKKAAEQLQTDLETFSKEIGDSAGSMMQNLRELTREKYDYASFLRKFAVLNEKMIINNDEFDYNYYTYGLELYDNMPLIEPLEYKEVKSIREFVIAIDTSGSVMGDEVQSFVTKTYNILKQQENFFSRINVHIIQCDAEIQEDIKITSNEEFEEYIKDMKLRGFGGTDFRPVFQYVDTLIKNKEFFNLKGLIYFTDGYGCFPARKPKYETAFVFVNDNPEETPEVPSWAIKLVLRRNELK